MKCVIPAKRPMQRPTPRRWGLTWLIAIAAVAAAAIAMLPAPPQARDPPALARNGTTAPSSVPGATRTPARARAAPAR